MTKGKTGEKDISGTALVMHDAKQHNLCVPVVLATDSVRFCVLLCSVDVPSHQGQCEHQVCVIS